jgi:large subunit ribosomal protein L15
MQFHELKQIHSLKKKKRVGHGGKKGTYSGRGIKGQKSRAGGTPRPVLRDIIKKFPKKRGYKFAGVKKRKPIILNVNILEEKLKTGEVINIAKLRARKFIRKKDKEVKILGDGELNKSLIFKGYHISFSESALKKIKKAGGKIEIKQKLRSTLPKAERTKKRKKIKKTIETEKQRTAKNTKTKKVGENIKLKKEKISKKPKIVKTKKAVNKKKIKKARKSATKQKTKAVKKKVVKKITEKKE